MDGVLVDFFGEWANMHGVDSWRDIRPLLKSQGKTIDDALDAIRAKDDFWINLKPHTGAEALLAAIKKYAGEYNILSSPLSNDPNSEPQKREWVKKNLSAFPPKEVIIHKRKSDYATQADGTPNILIDDYSSQVKPWAAAGGIALKHSNSNTEKTVNALKQQFETTAEEAWKVKLPNKNRKKMSKQDKDWSMLRTALESDLFEEGAGDCFHVAGRTMIDMTEEQETYGMKMIHAYVYGQGELKGRRFPHAWVEQGDVVLDNSNGNSIVMRKDQYYPLGGIVQESGAYATYVKEDCLIKMLKHSHWGPWDLNDSLDEGIPDETHEIGKIKSRIPSKTLNTIKDELDLETQIESAWERFKLDVA
jgi:5'(3')-deoxyribonucleotidase